MRKLFRSCVVAGVTAVLVVGALSLFTEAQAAPRCICPLIYAPVKCDNGKTYTNQCFATCAHATGCVPIGGPVPL